MDGAKSVWKNLVNSRWKYFTRMISTSVSQELNLCQDHSFFGSEKNFNPALHKWKLYYLVQKLSSIDISSDYFQVDQNFYIFLCFWQVLKTEIERNSETICRTLQQLKSGVHRGAQYLEFSWSSHWILESSAEKSRIQDISWISLCEQICKSHHPLDITLL